ncbi:MULTISPECIES: MFS transporter [Streptomyces violaceusniger group]|uniref:Aromatic acid/H+ symport family MFS transporter n=2 Tax=Streptomyces rhizosphaericus TaxID=114699 RepID=A0ABP4CTC4_9ACTN|nr:MULTISPECIES: MFS transporter [Streptomyces violaceusniger group]
MGLAVMTLEGFDLVAYGATTPLLLGYRPWHLSVAFVGLLGSLTPIGMLVGSLLVGQFTDRFGRRRTTLISIAVVSAGMFACAVAPLPSLFGAGRFVVGLGVGAIYPAMGPLIFELAPDRRKNLYSGIVQCGTAIGGSFAALVANTLLSGHSFHQEYLVGGIAGLLLLPMAFVWLPESTEYHQAVSASAPDLGNRGVRLVLRPPYRGTTLMFCAMAALSFLLIFAMNTWLPRLMQTADYPLQDSQTFLVLLNLGATVGGLAMALLADRAGSRGPITASFALGAAAIVAMSAQLPLPVLYGIVIVGGCGAVGVQGLINVYISRSYPVTARASAVGVALGVGRIGGIAGPTFGGWILAAGLEPRWNFVLFAVPAVLGAALALAVGGRTSQNQGRPAPAPRAKEPTAGHTK